MTKSDPTLVARLARIEGQVRGVARMLAEERYCIDVLDQLQAIKAALKKVEEQILKNHVDHCVANSVESGNISEQRKKFAELADLLARYAR
jgi:CsoR family transcriptional regulator, copper-sensing transcriptional repressor